MKKSLLDLLSFLLFGGTFLFLSCNDVQEPIITDNNQGPQRVLTLIATLSDSSTGSRLIYSSNGTSIKTLWDESDQLAANPVPSNEENVYLFHLSEGGGTTQGTFICDTYPNIYKPENFHTNAWTIYFPGSMIQGEQDFLNFSYIGQTQTGNDNFDHIGDYHSIRLSCGDGATSFGFNTTYIDFSSENMEESACMKFVLNGFETPIVPAKIELMYADPDGNYVSCFHTYNFLTSYWGAATVNGQTTTTLSLNLSGIGATNTVTAYMMMSNYPVSVKANGTFRVYVTDKEGNRFYCDKTILADAILEGGKMHRITCSEWTDCSSCVDGLINPNSSTTALLQEATVAKGTDIIIMGDGFAEDKFGVDGLYETVMEQAYEDFFSVEPYRSLKNYFNVFYINAVSEDNHDAVPQLNGAVNGTAVTRFNTQFTPGTTRITGNDDMALEYAKQVIRYRGGAGGTALTDEAVINQRANSALMMVMVNVECHAGTCAMVWDNSTDYAKPYSVAYTALGTDAESRRLVTVHEAGGHGFGKLADEYGGATITSFSTGYWSALRNQHCYGINRNVNEYWTADLATSWTGLSWDYTTEDNVFWEPLFDTDNNYETNEGLSIIQGANTYENLYCRSTENSLMRNQFTGSGTSGEYFNAISRWAIWYRLMRLTGGATFENFNASFQSFMDWDKTILDRWTSSESIARTVNYVEDNKYAPLAPPKLIKGRWVNGDLVIEK